MLIDTEKSAQKRNLRYLLSPFFPKKPCYIFNKEYHFWLSIYPTLHHFSQRLGDTMKSQICLELRNDTSL